MNHFRDNIDFVQMAQHHGVNIKKIFQIRKKLQSKNYLISVFCKELKLIFKRLSDSNLLRRCLKGLPQDQNEVVNATLWKRCSVQVFCDKLKLTACVA